MENLTTEQVAGIVKKYALELEKLSLTDHTCVVNLIMRFCERRQTLFMEQMNENAARAQQGSEGVPHLIKQ